jgi:acylglycerol lipase
VGLAVVQHGYGEYADRFVEQHGRLIPRLVEAGLEVWAMDLWGHGESPGARGVTHVGLAVRDHLEMRRAARDRGLPVVAIGHSLGGLVTAGSVSSDPAGLAGVVLSGAALPAEPRAVRRLLGAMARVAPAMPIPARRSPLSGLSRDPQVVERASGDPRMVHRQVPVVLAATAIDISNGVRDRADSWSVPTLIQHGSADVYTDPAGSRDLFDHIVAPDKTWREVPDGLHELFHDHGREEIVADTVAWALSRAVGASDGD